MEALTREVFQGLNLLTIIGFIAMGVGINQSRQGRARAPVAIALMVIGTVLVFAGLYFAHATS
jgi:membrane-bound ClpP family serine protease